MLALRKTLCWRSWLGGYGPLTDFQSNLPHKVTYPWNIPILNRKVSITMGEVSLTPCYSVSFHLRLRVWFLPARLYKMNIHLKESNKEGAATGKTPSCWHLAIFWRHSAQRRSSDDTLIWWWFVEEAVVLQIPWSQTFWHLKNQCQNFKLHQWLYLAIRDICSSK